MEDPVPRNDNFPEIDDDMRIDLSSDAASLCTGKGYYFLPLLDRNEVGFDKIILNPDWELQQQYFEASNLEKKIIKKRFEEFAKKHNMKLVWINDPGPYERLQLIEYFKAFDKEIEEKKKKYEKFWNDF